ncbi:Hypp144 [Branchiostoma lanceolatum]|uniref:Hypp144 protein n=1 Tax=Branchiostoma lanceolatum TaxID=7740 RepID=A0A8J9V712_BRALA|nr:Hypp144 [Branchiostoma lanceolatum]
MVLWSVCVLFNTCLHVMAFVAGGVTDRGCPPSRQALPRFCAQCCSCWTELGTGGLTAGEEAEEDLLCAAKEPEFPD